MNGVAELAVSDAALDMHIRHRTAAEQHIGTLSMKIAILSGALGLALLSSTAFAQAPAPMAGGTASPIDRQFAGNAAASNTFEILSSRLALRKSRDPAVRDMARWMIDAHTGAERKLQGAATYADDQGAAGPALTPTTSATLDDLRALDGAAFDKAYVDAQVAAHEMTARQMDDYAVQGSYAPLLRYDAMTLPEVDAHLAHFRDLQAHMDRGSSDDM